MADATRGMSSDPNEGDWLHGPMPSGLINYVIALATDRRIDFHLSAGQVERKLRLFYCACARRVWHLLTDAESRRVVEVCERFAVARAGKDELRAAVRAAEEARRKGPNVGRQEWERYQASDLPLRAARVSVNGPRHLVTQDGWPVESDEQIAILKDLFGNPFRPVAIDAAHRTPTVIDLARAAHEERNLPAGELDAHRLSVLADALEEVGAADEIAAHLRSPGSHVRGCWAVDLCLGSVQK